MSQTITKVITEEAVYRLKHANIRAMLSKNVCEEFYTNCLKLIKKKLTFITLSYPILTNKMALDHVIITCSFQDTHIHIFL